MEQVFWPELALLLFTAVNLRSHNYASGRSILDRSVNMSIARTMKIRCVCAVASFFIYYFVTVPAGKLRSRTVFNIFKQQQEEEEEKKNKNNNNNNNKTCFAAAAG